MLPFILIAVSGLAALGWIIYFRWKDALHPEPLWLLGVTLMGGVAAAFLALLEYFLLENLGHPTDWSDLAGTNLGRAIGMGLRIGLIEEAAKFLPVLAVVLFSKELDEPLDGIVYAGCAGLGLATAETAIQLYNGAYGFVEGLARAVTGPIGHALLSAPWGLGIARYVLNQERWKFFVGFAVSLLCHAAYDVLLARPELPPVAGAGVVLGLWIWLMWVCPKLVQERPASKRKKKPAPPTVT